MDATRRRHVQAYERLLELISRGAQTVSLKGLTEDEIDYAIGQLNANWVLTRNGASLTAVIRDEPLGGVD